MHVYDRRRDVRIAVLSVVIVLYHFARISQRDDLAVFEAAAVYGQPYECPVHVPPLKSSRSRVDVQQSESLVIFYFKYMRVSDSEQLWR